MKRRIFPVTALALTLAAGLSATSAFAQTKWDLAAAYPATNFHTENMVQLAGDVDKATGGKLKITVHANAALFKAPEIKRAVQGGQAQMGEILLANFQNEWQLFGVDGLPFLADSYDASKKLYAAQKPFLEKKLAEQGMVLLYAVAWPPQGIYTKKPLASAADLKGIKWRAYSPATARIAELVGAQPVTVQAAEFSQALATGVVESTMTSGATGTVGPGDLLILFSLILLFFELLKSTSSQKIAIINHALSMILFVVCLIAFLLLRGFATSTFFLITVMVLLDVLAGFIVTIISARKDFDIGTAAG